MEGRRAKLVATIGPASADLETLTHMISAGVDVARVNASHADRGELGVLAQLVRSAAESAGRNVALLVDLAGPKLRVGEMEPDVVLSAGLPFQIRMDECLGTAQGACVSHAGLAEDVSAGDIILLDDGRIGLRVVATRPDSVETVVTVGGPLRSHKGLNVPGVTLGVEAITPKDVEDVRWALDAGAEYIAMSFVRSAADIRELRVLLGASDAGIVAKIEKHEALGDLAAIVDAADIVMVARGDLGVETSVEQVPLAQRRVVAACREAGKPVIVATQMLESMVCAPRPTRAEASDVANAVFEGVDAVMLSAETAVGLFPVAAVETADRIMRVAESAPHLPMVFEHDGADGDVTAAVSAAVSDLAERLGVRAILTATRSGATARAVARRRPCVPILAATPDAAVARRSAAVWGVESLVIPHAESVEAMLREAVSAAVAAGAVAPGDLVAFTAGVTVNVPGSTDLIQVHRVPGDA